MQLIRKYVPTIILAGWATVNCSCLKKSGTGVCKLISTKKIFLKSAGGEWIVKFSPKISHKWGQSHHIILSHHAKSSVPTNIKTLPDVWTLFINICAALIMLLKANVRQKTQTGSVCYENVCFYPLSLSQTLHFFPPTCPSLVILQYTWCSQRHKINASIWNLALEELASMPEYV